MWEVVPSPANMDSGQANIIKQEVLGRTNHLLSFDTTDSIENETIMRTHTDSKVIS
jgi:hypothetical protein